MSFLPSFTIVPFVLSTLSIISKFDISLIAPLHFLEFSHNRSTFVAMIDSGSQLNLIDKTILPLIKSSLVSAPHYSFRGVQGHTSPIHEWVEFNVLLANGMKMKVKAAVVDSIPCSIIFGQPFLITNQVMHDPSTTSIITRRGPIKLLSQQSRTPTTAAVVSEPTESETEDLDKELNLKDSMLEHSQKIKLRQLMHGYRKLWAGKHPGWVKHVKHRVRVDTDEPIRDRPRFHTNEQNKEIKRQIDDMLQHGIIRPSNSPHASEIVMAKKKDSDGNFTGWRLCLDYRPLNRHTIRDAYPIPRITDLLRSIKGSSYFVAIDLRWGYWNIPMSRSSIKYTAFRCILGLYEFLKMPFGLTNAPATFQRMADFLFGDLREKGVLAYLDDILVHASTFEECLAKLKVVLDRIEAEGLVVNIEKTNFFPSRLKYLGHIIQNGTTVPNPAKTEVLNKIRKPQNVYDVRRLLGMLGYYHPYLPDFAGTMAPVFDLIAKTPNSKRRNKVTAVEWKEVHENAVRKAVGQLQTAVLTIPLESDNFRLETDASGTSIAVILSCQRNNGLWMPVEFASKKLGIAQKRWPIRDQEAFAIIFGLKKFETYLKGRSFQVFTDHKSLQWMLGAKEGRVARWASRLSEFNLSIVHKGGNQVEHVDYLTRFIDLDDDFDVDPHMSYATTNVVRATPTTLPSVKEVVAEQQKVDRPAIKGIYSKDGVLYYHNAIWVPPSLRIKVIAACHIVSPYNHNGKKSTVNTIKRAFNWPRLDADVAEYRSACLGCQRTRQGTERLQGLLETHPISGPFNKIYVDYWECFYNGTKFVVLTIVDSLTKWVECTPLPSKETAPVVSAFISSWICRFGVPSTIVNDNDKVLTSKVVRGLQASFGTKCIEVVPYHHDGNALIESFHRHLNRGLATFESPNKSVVPFNEALQLVLFSYRSTIHSTTGESPAFMVYGFDPRPPMDNDWRTVQDVPMAQRLKFLNEMRLDVQWKAFNRRLTENDKRNDNRFTTEFELHQLVLVRLAPHDRIKLAHYTGDIRHKLIPKWSVPCRVIEVKPCKKIAVARNLLTSEDRLVHLQDVRFIQRPQTEVQQLEWNQTLKKEVSSMFNADARDAALFKFWERIDYPQLNVEDPKPRHVKRRRKET